jgi:hypothetical protein
MGKRFVLERFPIRPRRDRRQNALSVCRSLTLESRDLPAGESDTSFHASRQQPDLPGFPDRPATDKLRIETSTRANGALSGGSGPTAFDSFDCKNATARNAAPLRRQRETPSDKEALKSIGAAGGGRAFGKSRDEDRSVIHESRRLSPGGSGPDARQHTIAPDEAPVPFSSPCPALAERTSALRSISGDFS